MKPTVGRIVHYFERGLDDFPPNRAGPYAAIITSVHSNTCIDVVYWLPGSPSTHATAVTMGSPDAGVRRWWEWPPR